MRRSCGAAFCRVARLRAYVTPTDEYDPDPAAEPPADALVPTLERILTISADLEAQILRHHYAEHWPPGTIARQLGVHHGTVQRVLAQAGVPRAARVARASRIDLYLPFLQETLRQYPRLTASRLYAMASARGYAGSASHFAISSRSCARASRRKRTCACARCRASRARSTGATSAR